MPTLIKKSVVRETTSLVFERGRKRAVILSLEPPNLVGVRLKGMKQVYHLPADAVFMLALKAAQG